MEGPNIAGRFTPSSTQRKRAQTQLTPSEKPKKDTSSKKKKRPSTTLTSQGNEAKKTTFIKKKVMKSVIKTKMPEE